MPYVQIPKDLSRVRTKIAFGLNKRQLICFGSAAFIGVPVYLFTRVPLGTEAAVLLMIGLMLPFFFLAMYERDGQPAEKILRNWQRRPCIDKCAKQLPPFWITIRHRAIR